ncbi:phage tail tape measure protein [Stutzerimonas kunmingensis]|uniref:phage tail tape measure protein n=1 Tax=Stutzerimonas kunmingensis TaxID=1211807 RepID=UPI0028A5D0FA|nr:phage tail tape measure protein [Stutzerimonas kunmingensis]
MARDLKLQVVLAAIDKATAPIKSVMQGSVGLGRAMKATRETLKGLQAQQKDVSSFRALKGASEQTAAAIQANRDRVKQLSQQLASTASPTRALSREFQTAVRQAQALKQKHSEQQRELQGLRGKLGQAGISTRNLSDHERQLRQRITETNSTLSQQEQRLKAVSTQQKKLARAQEQYQKAQGQAGSMAAAGAGGLAMGGGILYTGAAMVAPHLAAQQQGSLIAAQQGEGGDRAAAYQGMIQGIRTAGVSTDMVAIGTAVAAVNSTLGTMGDVSDKELDRASRKALDMAAVLGGDVAEHIQTAAIMMKNGLAGSSDEAFDLITRGMQGVSTQMRGELPEILHEYSTHFRGLGFDGNEAMSLLVEMAKQGKFALDKTGDALKEFSIRGSDMSKASQDAYAAIGLDAAAMSSAIAEGGDNARRAMQQTAKGLLAVTDPAERANTAIALFGTPIEDLAIDQIPGFLRALTGAQGNLGDVDGAAAALGDTLRDNLQGDIGRLTGAWSELSATLFASKDGVMREVAQAITRIIQGVTSWAKEHPALSSGLFSVAAGLGIIIAGMGGLTLAIASILGPFAMFRYGMMLFGIQGGGLATTLFNLGKKALPLVGKGILLIGRALLMNPIGLAVTAIAAAAYLIYRNWDRVGPYFRGLWSEIKAGFSGGLGGIAATIVNFSPVGLFYRAFAGVLSYLGVDLPARFTEFGGMLMQGLVNGIKNAAGAVKGAVVGAADSSINFFKEKLGIHSPSRVFAELGGFTMQGLAQGLVGGEGGMLKEMAGIAKRLTQAGAVALGVTGGAAFADQPLSIDNRPPLSAPAASASGAASGSTTTITITINAAPGQDANAIAQAVAAELDRRERQNQARQRGSFHDLE